MKKILGLLLLVLVLSGCTEGMKRELKSINSNFSGGLNRVVSVYSYNGDLLREYEGKLDVQLSEGGKVMFDLNGKRIMLYNVVVVVEEK